MLSITEILVEHRNSPIGLDLKRPRFTWKLISDGQNVKQESYQIIVSSSGTVFWDTGRIKSDQSVLIEYKGEDLSPMTVYTIEIKSWDNNGETAVRESNFETGLMGNFRAVWITHDLPDDNEACPVFKKEFTCKKEIVSARIYSTALGIYDLEINGKRVSDEYFSPGWTSYNNRLQYQTYNVMDMLGTDNELKATIANGWYKGNLAYEGRKNIYGDKAALLLELHVTYSDDTKDIIMTDGSWMYATGEVRYSEIYHGETIDKTFEPDTWLYAQTYDHGKDMIIAQESEPVRITKRIPAVELITTPKGEKVIDFGQNLTGFVEFVCECDRGTELILKHAEVLDKDGNFYLENIRAAKATDRYITNGQIDIYRPRFTFHGFRYAMIEGNKNKIDLSRIRACVLHTDMKETGTFECSNELVNQLQHNIQWGQRGNFLDIPTDCPQRDERLGWTGDAQVFASTAAYNFDTALFFTKWLKDLAADQGENGEVPFVIPDALIRNDGKVPSSAAWGDAAVIVPWIVYKTYGDIKVIENQYKSMKAWVDYLASEAGHTYLWKNGSHFGDWLGLDMEQYFTFQRFSVDASTGSTDKHYIASAFFAYSTEILINAAEATGRHDDVRKYRKLHKNIVKAFQNEYMTPNGRLVCETQTGLLLALKFNLVDEKNKEAIADRLVKNIKRHNMQMVTGFVGASYLCPVLTETGHHDIAGQLLLQTKYPSWLYPVTKGATTIWERWNGIKPDGTFENPEMNSFNHYAYGAIGDWMYKKVLGISEIEPGYKKIKISPMPISGLEYAKGSYETPYGPVSVSWKREGDSFIIDVDIPVNTEAMIEFPSSRPGVNVGSGKYHFE